jgi:hypothetical protein
MIDATVFYVTETILGLSTCVVRSDGRPYREEKVLCTHTSKHVGLLSRPLGEPAGGTLNRTIPISLRISIFLLAAL